MLAVNPYLTFPGNAEEAFNFYRSVFGGEFAMLIRFDGSPGSENLSDEDKQKIMHIALPVGNGILLMASDTTGSMGPKFVAGNNFHLSISVESNDEADQLYAKLSAGGQAAMPMTDMFWGDYFGMLTDRFGLQWMISYDKNAVSK